MYSHKMKRKFMGRKKKCDNERTGRKEGKKEGRKGKKERDEGRKKKRGRKEGNFSLQALNL